METWIGFAVLLFVALLVFSIVVVAELGKLRSGLNELRRRLTDLEGRRAAQKESVPPPRVVPPPLPAFLQPPPDSAPTIESRTSAPEWSPPSTINWESILGVKLFAWIGGLALFLGVVFFVKYSFENNLITPTMRVISGRSSEHHSSLSASCRHCGAIAFRRKVFARRAC